MTEAPARPAIPAPAVVNALWAQGQGRRLAKELSARLLDVLVLSGPEVQVRLFGTPATYPSPTLDLLTRSGQGADVRDALEALGYRLHASNAPSWRLAGHATFLRAGHVVHLRWRATLTPLPAPLHRRWRAALWSGATPGTSGFYEPRAEPLFVALAVDAARGARDEAARAALAAAVPLVTDLRALRSIASSCRVRAIVRAALDGVRPAALESLPLDGVPAAVDRALDPVAHASFVPAPLRQMVAEHLSYRRHGLSVVRPGARSAAVAGSRMEWWEGVCGPGTWSDDLVDLWLRAVDETPTPVLVEVGTGTGALAIVAAARRRDAEVHAIDISFRAARNARANVERHAARVDVHRGDLLHPLPARARGHVDSIVAHLPSMWLGGYPDDEVGREDVWAPRETYEGSGGDGLDLFRRLLAEAKPWLSPRGRIVISMQAWQWQLFEPDADVVGYRAVDQVVPSATGIIVMLAPRSPATMPPAP